jgi:hypothetical protein
MTAAPMIRPSAEAPTHGGELNPLSLHLTMTSVVAKPGGAGRYHGKSKPTTPCRSDAAD